MTTSGDSKAEDAAKETNKTSPEEPELDEEEIDSYIISTPKPKRKEKQNNKVVRTPTKRSSEEERAGNGFDGGSASGSRAAGEPMDNKGNEEAAVPSTPTRRMGVFGYDARQMLRGFVSPVKVKPLMDV